jgi:hypothetical protein
MDGSRGALTVARDDVAGLSTATEAATETAAAAAAAPITISTTIPAAAAAAEATTPVAARTGAGAGVGASATAAGAGVAVIAKVPAPRGPLASCLAGLHPRQPEQLQQLQQRRVTWQETVHVWGADPQATPPRLPPLPSDDAAAAAASGVPLAPPLPPVSIKSLREQLVDCYIVTQGLLRRNPSKLFVPWQDRRFQFHKHHLSYFRPEEATPRGTNLLFLKK